MVILRRTTALLTYQCMRKRLKTVVVNWLGRASHMNCCGYSTKSGVRKRGDEWRFDN